MCLHASLKIDDDYVSEGEPKAVKGSEHRCSFRTRCVFIGTSTLSKSTTFEGLREGCRLILEFGIEWGEVRIDMV